MENSPHLKRHECDLEALHVISQILATHSGQKKMLQEILRVLDEALGMIRGTVMLLSADGSELVVEALLPAPDCAEPQESPAVRYRRGEGITGRVVETGEPAIVPLISREPDFRDRIHRRILTAEDRELSFICVPIVLGNEVVGTLSVDRPYDETALLQEDQRLLTIVASMIANDVKARRLARLERQQLEAENLRLRSAVEERFRPENIIGNSRMMREVYLRIHQVAQTDTTVLIRGESGTGKELVASALHYSSPRGGGPFIKVNCAALNEHLLESELFGHEKGSFTGALATRIGRFEEADGGTLFLDEIGEFSPAIQIKLLRVLQEREYERVGSSRARRTNVRIIAATHRDLEQAVAHNVFRQDLYYRINVFPIHLPPLRERKDDLLLLANCFVEKYAEKMNKRVRRISTPAINMLLAYHWPGNVRELENCIEHAVLLTSDGVIHGHNLPPTLQLPEPDERTSVGSLKANVHLLERDMIVDMLKQTGGSITLAAQELGITARMVRYKIKKLDIDYQHLFKRRGRPRKPLA